MSDQSILEKIAYHYYEHFKGLGCKEDKDRDWDCAVRALKHLREPINEQDYWWRFHEEDYGQFRSLLQEIK